MQKRVGIEAAEVKRGSGPRVCHKVSVACRTGTKIFEDIEAMMV